jgi:trk system potassium uptake protein
VPIRDFVRPADRGAVAWHLGSVLLLGGALLLAPLVVAVVTGDLPRAVAFAAMAAGTSFAGWLARRGDEPYLRRREALLVVPLTYLLMSLVGAVAFLGVMPPVDAVFESMSGFTTTGLTLLEVEEAPDSLLFFRAYSQWLGGAGIIVVALVVLSDAGGAMSRLFTSEYGQDNLLGSVVKTARLVGAIYGILTAIAYLALLLVGAGPFDGLLHALSLTSTGGFSPFDDSIAGYQSPGIAAVVAIGMLVGAISIPLFWKVRRRGWRQLTGDAQLRALLLLSLVGFLGIFAAMGFQAPGVAAFQSISALSTTGYGVVGVDALPAEGQLVTALLMVVGGGLGSTAGGIKLMRLLLLVALLRWGVQRWLLPPRAVVPMRVGGDAQDRDALLAGLVMVTAYAAVAAVGVLALSAAGRGVGPAAFDAISALSTVGLSSGFTDPDLPDWSKLVLTFAMWAGRVEVLPVLLLLHPRNWGRAEGNEREGDHRRNRHDG